MSKMTRALEIVSDLSRELNLDFLDGDSKVLRLIRHDSNLFECWIYMEENKMIMIWNGYDETPTKTEYLMIMGICKMHELEYDERFNVKEID